MKPRAQRFCLLLSCAAMLLGCGTSRSNDVTTGVPEAGACGPNLPESWKPSWAPPIQPDPHACSKEQIEALYAKCDVGSPAYDVAACRALKADPANGTCIRCMYSAEGDATWGANVTFAGSVWANVGGCIAWIDGDNSETGCGRKWWAHFACDEVACARCAASSRSSCHGEAAMSACSSYF